MTAVRAVSFPKTPGTIEFFCCFFSLTRQILSMSIATPAASTATFSPAGTYDALAERVLAGGSITREEALAILDAPDLDVPAILAAGYRIRHHHFGNSVQLYFLMNAKSGLCPEDCHYCSQSKVSDAPVPKYNILKRDELMEAARVAAERGAKTYCLVISARGPNEREMNAVEKIVPEIKQKYNLDICACLGLLSTEQAERLKACGVDRVNHNLNSSESHYEKICTTHTYADRVQTLRNVRDAGMEMCSGGIIGMGEAKEDIVSMAFDLAELGVKSIPVNILNAIDGTPLEGTDAMSAQDALKALAMFRFVAPDRELRIAGGRELHLRSLQPQGLYVANSLFVGDYLTTKGQAPQADYDMITDLGFEITGSCEEVSLDR
ncbi:biotin synthase [Rhodopirellula sallentina SM41]|uniref:Biotin synthase n=2 Tax=Rhodopirellula TaxID=265488 RepID=M5U2A6_9BACT|nr:biotin synthase [Rhodopirellula sallentina SM41]